MILTPGALLQANIKGIKSKSKEFFYNNFKSIS